MEKLKSKKGLVIGIVFAIAVVVILLTLALLPSVRTIPISHYLRDGESVVHEIRGYGTRLHVKLVSRNDDMRVRIVVDGLLIDEARGYSINREYSMGFGYHTIHVYIENPTVFGMGPAIWVLGEISLTLW